jgi:uncharacterized lipoprotein YbaY
VSGAIVLPKDAPRRRARLVLIQVQDASVQDAPARVLAETQLADIPLEPEGRIAFRLSVPDAAPGRRLLVRVHVDLAGAGRVSSGDLLTTAAHALPARGPAEGLDVPVVVI